VRLVRFVCLAAALAAVYVGGHIFQQHNLRDFFPTFILDAAPALYDLIRWLPEDLLTLAWWLSVLAAIFFGLVAPSWPLEEHASWPTVSPAKTARRFRLRSARLLLIFALVAAAGNLIYLMMTGNESLPVRLVWVASIFLWLVGCARLNPPVPPSETRMNHNEAAQPAPLRPWGGLLLILACAGLVFGWQIVTLPALMTEETAQYGLQALAAARGEEVHLFINSRSAISPLGVMPAALAIRILGDPLLGLQIAGLIASLLTVLATWLVGSELFRRPIAVGLAGEPSLDAGEWAALLAAGLVTASTIMIHFSRIPFYLEPVAWGCLGLWAWLRGLRMGNLLALGLSGVLCGWAALLYQNGMLFCILIMLWWLGVWLLQPSWLRRPYASGRLFILVWLGGLLVTLAPLVGAWLRTPGLWLERWQGSAFSNFPGIVTIFNLDPDLSSYFGYPGDGVEPLLAPLLILAAGALLLNLDRMVGWCLMTWCFGALLFAALLSSHAPFWPVLLPVLPALALILAFTLDRVRTTLLETAGVWIVQATTYLAASLVIWAGLSGWTHYLDFVQKTNDAGSYTSRVIQRLDPQQPVAIVLGQQRDHINPETPLLHLANARRRTPLAAITAEEWPTGLAPGAILLLQPEDQALLPALAQRYPGGVVTITRDHHANPVVYLYHAP
jgi:hypothetical protein